MARLGAGGTALERTFIAKLLKQGYLMAQRTAGSHSPVDVVAINPNKQYEGYQIKRAKLHKYVTTRLSEAKKEVGDLPVSIRIWCSQHRQWYDY